MLRARVVFCAAWIGLLSGQVCAQLAGTSRRPVGLALDWQLRHDHGIAGHDSAGAMAMAADGTLYVAAQTCFVGSVTDIALLKYDPGGVLEWARFYHGGGGTDQATGIGLDSAGDIYVCGDSIAPTGGVNFDWVLLKFDSQGDLLWSAREAGSGGSSDYTRTLHVGDDDEAILVGSMVAPGGVLQQATVRYDSAGNKRWQAVRSGSSSFAADLITDHAGNVFVASGDRLVADDRNGSELWTRPFDDPAYTWSDARQIELDPAGRLVVAGTRWDPAAQNQICTVLLDGRGRRLAQATTGLSGSESVSALAVSPTGEIAVAGNSNNGHDQDILILRYRVTP